MSLRFPPFTWLFGSKAKQSEHCLRDASLSKVQAGHATVVAEGSIRSGCRNVLFVLSTDQLLGRCPSTRSWAINIGVCVRVYFFEGPSPLTFVTPMLRVEGRIPANVRIPDGFEDR